MDRQALEEVFADIVAERYKLSREYQDEYSLESQRRMAAAQQANKFKDEIVPITVKMKVVDKATGAETMKEVTSDRDEGIRPDTLLLIGQFDHWATPMAKDFGVPSMNSLATMSMDLTDATGSGADIVRVKISRAGEGARS